MNGVTDASWALSQNWQRHPHSTGFTGSKNCKSYRGHGGLQQVFRKQMRPGRVRFHARRPQEAMARSCESGVLRRTGETQMLEMPNYGTLAKKVKGTQWNLSQWTDLKIRLTQEKVYMCYVKQNVVTKALWSHHILDMTLRYLVFAVFGLGTCFGPIFPCYIPISPFWNVSVYLVCVIVCWKYLSWFWCYKGSTVKRLPRSQNRLCSYIYTYIIYRRALYIWKVWGY